MFTDLFWLAIITIPGSLVFGLYFYSFTRMPMGNSTLLFYAALSLGTAIWGILFFQEKITRAKLFSLLLGFGGLILVSNASFSFSGLLPVAVCILAGLCGSIEVTFSKKISAHIPAVQISWFLYLAAFVINFILFLIVEKSPLFVAGTPLAWLGALGHSAATALAFYFAVKGFELVEPIAGGIIGLMEIVFAIIFGVIFFSEAVTLTTIIGAGLIMFAAMITNFAAIAKN